MDKEEFLHKYIEDKAEKFAMRKPKSPSFLNYIMGRIDFYKELGNERIIN